MNSAVAKPDWKVTLDGVDLSDNLRPYLINLRVSERRGGEADQLDISLDDSTGSLEIPKAGALLSVSLGWKGGAGTRPGLTDKGSFTVDEAEHSGPPDRITLRARSADFTAQWRKLRDQTWNQTTLGAVLREVAARQGVTAKIAASLAAKPLALVTQSRESDHALINRLGREHDAVATVKQSSLIFVPMAGGRSASGEALPSVTIRRSEGDRHRYSIEAREDWTGVVAKWHDKKAASEKLVKVEKRKRSNGAIPRSETASGTKENPKILKKIFATEAEAKRAAEAEWQRIQRAPRKLSLNLALGRPEIGVEQPALVKGFKSEIDEQDWIVAEASHTLDGNGLTTSLIFELPDNPAEGGAEEDESSATEQPATSEEG